LPEAIDLFLIFHDLLPPPPPTPSIPAQRQITLADCQHQSVVCTFFMANFQEWKSIIMKFNSRRTRRRMEWKKMAT